jgi:hypothetical protein
MSDQSQFPFRQWLFLTAMGAVSGAVFFVFAGIPLVALRRICGRYGYWAGTLLMVSIMTVLGFLAPAALTLILGFVIAMYVELRLVHYSPSKSALLSLLSSTISVGSGVFFWVQSVGTESVNRFKQTLFKAGSEFVAAWPNLKVDLEMAWRQLPAAVVISIAAALALGLIFESRLVNRLSKNLHDDETMRLYEYRNADAMVWVSIVTLLGAFLELGFPQVQIVCQNIFYVLVFLYFFQGLAIVATFFALMRVAFFWQSLWYFVLVFQLLPVVSLLGFADYWLNFRQRLIRRTTDQKRGNLS